MHKLPPSFCQRNKQPHEACAFFVQKKSSTSTSVRLKEMKKKVQKYENKKK